MNKPFILSNDFIHLVNKSLPIIQSSTIEIENHMPEVSYNIVCGKFIQHPDFAIHLALHMPPTPGKSIEDSFILFEYYVPLTDIVENVSTIMLDLEMIYREDPLTYPYTLKQIMLHEARHAYQRATNMFEFVNWKGMSADEIVNLPYEKDADEFANKYKSNIPIAPFVVL